MPAQEPPAKPDPAPHPDLAAGDPFATAALREQVLTAWVAAPARFREDANAEEDYALGGYRDRLVVELAQNAADAAARAGAPGRLLLRLTGRTLMAANTGAPLDAAGVESLSTLRASAKRDQDTVGRFGVGFAAVLAVTDEPAVLSAGGAVRWSAKQARQLVAAQPSLAAELDRRGGHVPALRLPFPAAGRPPDGYTTAVVLPLRDDDAERLARRLLDEIDPVLLIALPALTEVRVEVDDAVRRLRAERAPSAGPAGTGDTGPPGAGGAVVVHDDDAITRWRLARASGRADPELLADRPTEERARPGWSLTWAAPVDAAGRPAPLPRATPAVVHAPTPTAERLDLPAVLLASFPLDSGRRQVAPGPLRDHLVEHAGRAYAALLRDLGPAVELLDLVPGPLPAGELDALIRRAILAALPDVPFLPAAAGPGPALRPRDAVVVEGVDESVVGMLADVLPGLLPAAAARRRSPLVASGVRVLALADVVDALAGLDREPAWWRALYAALAHADLEALGALPVPLVDGRTVAGPRGLLLPGPDLPAHLLAGLPLRVAHPAAVHPLLERLGARPATPRTVLADPPVQAAVRESYDAEDPAPLADAVLALVAAAGLAPGEEPWLAELALPDSAGDLAPAGELLLPGGPLADLVEEDALGQVADELVVRWGGSVLEAVGVLRTFAVVREPDVPVDAMESDHDLDREDAWLDDLRARLPGGEVPPVLAELVAVRDLDLVAPQRWGDALRLLSAPPLRETVTTPALVHLGDGGRAELPTYTAWWLRRHPVLDGQRPRDVRVAGSDPLLVALYDEVATGLDAEFLRAIGVRTDLAALLADPEGPDQLLHRLGDPERRVSREQLRPLYLALADVEPSRVAPRSWVRVIDGVDGTATAVVGAADALVVDAPDLLPLVTYPVLVPADRAEALADVLGLDLASERVPGRVESAGEERPVPRVVRAVLADALASWVAHERLVVDGMEVGWRVRAGEVHATGPAGLARGLAWAGGQWGRRHLVAALLAEPGRLGELLAEEDLDG